MPLPFPVPGHFDAVRRLNSIPCRLSVSRGSGLPSMHVHKFHGRRICRDLERTMLLPFPVLGPPQRYVVLTQFLSAFLHLKRPAGLDSPQGMHTRLQPPLA